MNSQEAYEYCRQLAENKDRDRYILSLAASAETRPALWAVIAFNHEIAKVRDVTRETVTGHIRLTWWRDALMEGKYSHEVLTALRDTITRYNLPVQLLIDLIDARMRDADNTPAPALDLYAAETNLPLLKIFALIVGANESDAALNDLAIAYGLTGLMRSLSYFIHHDDRILPPDTLASIGIAPEQFSHIKPGDKLFDYVRSIARQAHSHLDAAQPQAKIFKSMQKMTRLYLKAIERAGYNPFDARYSRALPFLALRVLI